MTVRPPCSVMLVTPNLDIGGAQETVRMLAANLPRHGHPTVVCSFTDGPLRADIERLGVPVELLPERRFSVVALPLFVAEMVRLRIALAAIRLVLAKADISSQLVDNLNASIHLRALLTDLFVVDEALKPPKVRS